MVVCTGKPANIHFKVTTFEHRISLNFSIDYEEPAVVLDILKIETDEFVKRLYEQ